MLRRECRIKSAIAGLIIAGIYSLSFSTAAQQPGPQSKRRALAPTIIFDDDVVKLHQQIKELRNPTFRAFLRMRLLSLLSAEPGPIQRVAAMDVATQGITDLCEHQNEVWTETASWLHESLVKQIKALHSSEATAPDICILTKETGNDSTKNFASGIKMLRNPEKNEARLTAEERIKNASDQLEQMIFEANLASDEQLKQHFFFHAARLAKQRGQLTKAVDLGMKVTNERAPDRGRGRTSWEIDFLLEIVSLAVKKNSPLDATYAISKMTSSLGEAKAFRLLGEYHAENYDKVKSNEAFAQSGKQLTLVKNGFEKVTTLLLLAESVLKYEPANAYEVFRESIRAINNLPTPEKDEEKMYYMSLLPVAENLISSFRLLATVESQTATSLAAEIKLAELRVSALSGVYTQVHN